MKALIQRSKGAKVSVDGKTIGEIGDGLVILLGVTHKDTEKDVDFLVNKIVNLRIFPGKGGSFDTSALDGKKEILVVSQFTLYGSCKKGRRPDFTEAAGPEQAETLYKFFVQKLREAGLKVATGQFQAYMQVDLNNDGPVTLVLESKAS
ncbi:D-tyrosyl-tRNA(Tyr) deacylase [Candidatus Peregrinibacteria bacterium]|nr:D-tyrosyl-tRNA(Tyr) deacylase [Candidatus Peregrinibacteria bacterium]